ncbi:uncharacterized protein V1518DRAFT_380691 [Limtongia smithiae]|uniref:uncharacterized protein n=1 Tax=Limtongia smithiae TaxID=1125753 RepID=UPI0034CE8DE8
MSTIMGENFEQIIRDRIAVNESAYRRITKQVQSIQQLTFADAEIIQTAQRDLNKALDHYEIQVMKWQLQFDVTAKESAVYETQREQIKDTYDRRVAISRDLESELSAARLRRTQVEEYDAYVRTALHGDNLHSRDELDHAIARLNTEITELEVQKNEYANLWRARSAQFGEIVAALQRMQWQIHEEKEEQDRREGMDADEDAQDASAKDGDKDSRTQGQLESAASSADGSRVQTPAVELGNSRLNVSGRATTSDFTNLEENETR